MSQALFEQAAGGKHEARSAGTAPADDIHPQVLAVMRELGIDLSGRKPQKLSHDMAEWADILVTMGCGDQCPYVPGRRYIDWDLPDPSARPIDEVRAIRDEIKRRIQELINELEPTAAVSDHG